MLKINDENRTGGSFLMSNFSREGRPAETNPDMIKILEICNFIDKWEQELLFSEKGFYSLKGKEVRNKSKEFLRELNDSTNSKIEEAGFLSGSLKKVMLEIKNSKLKSITQKMEEYETQQSEEWALEVYEAALSSSVKRAVLYKSDINIVQSSYSNGISVLNLISQKRNWSKKTLKTKENKYKSEFYYNLIKSFLDEKDINAYKYYSEYKDYLLTDDKEEIEKSVNELKENLIAYNWAKEIFSYNLTDNEFKKELNNIKDLSVKEKAEKLFKDFAVLEKRKKKEEEISENEKDWDKILEIAKTDITSAVLYIDYTLSTSHIRAVKEYLTQIKNKGYISTDKERFLEVFTELYEDFQSFKNKDISDYIACLNEEDYELLVEFQKTEISDFYVIAEDCKSLIAELSKKLKKAEDKYDCIKLLIHSLKEYKTINKKAPDLQARNKILEAIFLRFSNVSAEKDKKGEDK